MEDKGMQTAVSKEAQWSAVICEQEEEAPERIAGWPWGRLIALGRTVRYDRHLPLYHEGQAAAEVFVVQRGLVKLSCSLANGASRILRLRGSGSILGLSEMISASGKYRHSAVTVWGAQVLRISAVSLQQWRLRAPAEYLDLMENLEQELRDADRAILEFSTGGVQARVVKLIKHLSSVETYLPAGEVQLLTCQEMGEILGVTGESVSRVVADLKRRGVLRPCGGRPLDRFCFELSDLDAELSGDDQAILPRSA